MKRLVLVFYFISSCFASAEGLLDLTDQEREAFRAEVRFYLLENPEIIAEVIDALRTKQAEEKLVRDRNLVRYYSEPLLNDGTSYVLGNPEGEITIVEFSDYRCGYCRRSHPELKAILADNDDIRLIIKEFPILGADSTMAARAAVSILLYQRAFYEKFNDALMAYSGPASAVALSLLADEVGADGDLMIEKIEDEEITRVLARNHALGQAMEITGTPTFIIGDEMVRGYITPETLQLLLDEIRESS